MQIPEHMVDAVDRFLKGNASIADRQLISDWYHSETQDEVIVPTDESEVDLFARMKSRLLDEISEEPSGFKRHEPRPPIRRIGRSIIYRWTAAAIILLMVGVGASFWFRKQTPSSIQPSVIASTEKNQDILPGSKRATLILGNGRQIALDSAGKGLLAEEGATKVSVLGNGQLQYAKEASNNEKPGVAPVMNTLAIPRGGEYMLELSDGTKVWVNAASTLRFPNAFIGSQRIVELLKGEAYFEVTKNAKMPFIVKVPPHVAGDKDMNVEVLGTHFNINTYQELGTFNTTLLEGKVKVYTTAGTGQTEKAKILTPGQQSKLDKRGNISVLTDSVTAAASIAWKEGYFQFRETGIQEVMLELSRWYDIDVEYKDGIVPQQIAMVGRYSRSHNLSEALAMLRDVDIKYSITGRKLTILH